VERTLKNRFVANSLTSIAPEK